MEYWWRIDDQNYQGQLSNMAIENPRTRWRKNHRNINEPNGGVSSDIPHWSSCPTVHPRHSPLGSQRRASSAHCMSPTLQTSSMDWFEVKLPENHEFSTSTTTLYHINHDIYPFNRILGFSPGWLVKSLVKSTNLPVVARGLDQLRARLRIHII